MATVYCTECKEEHNVEEVKFVNIEEDEQGYDKLTFVCPNTGKTLQSLVRG